MWRHLTAYLFLYKSYDPIFVLTLSVFFEVGFLSLLAITRKETSIGVWQWLILAETSTWWPPRTIEQEARLPLKEHPKKEIFLY